MKFLRTFFSAALVLGLGLFASPVLAQNANCRNTGNFDRWLAEFKQEALSQGVSQRALSAAAPYLTFDQGIINRDRGQRVFGQTFLVFSGRMAADYRMTQGRKRIDKERSIFSQVEKKYGVPPEVIAAFWALESDFGVMQGKSPTLSALASLAYDCRRSAMFREELVAALKIVDKGDLTPAQMIGAWAGELGQTQFLAKHYLAYGVDFDGDGRVDLLKSDADVIASTANYIAHIGWKRGEPWMTEVRVPRELPWDQSDLDIQHPRSKWAAWGVTLVNGKPLPNDSLPASLLLPMGRMGPAFLVYDNFKMYTSWNNSLTYATTAAYLATRIAGASKMSPGNGKPPELSFEDTKDLQRILAKRGHDVGKIDGIMGALSRKAVATEQKRLGLPADAWPTPDLLAALRGGR